MKQLCTIELEYDEEVSCSMCDIWSAMIALPILAVSVVTSDYPNDLAMAAGFVTWLVRLMACTWFKCVRNRHVHAPRWMAATYQAGLAIMGFTAIFHPRPGMAVCTIVLVLGYAWIECVRCHRYNGQYERINYH